MLHCPFSPYWSKRRTQPLYLAEGEEFLVVTLGDIDHELLCAFRELSREKPWARRQGEDQPVNYLYIKIHMHEQQDNMDVSGAGHFTPIMLTSLSNSLLSWFFRLL